MYIIENVDGNWRVEIRVKLKKKREKKKKRMIKEKKRRRRCEKKKKSEKEIKRMWRVEKSSIIGGVEKLVILNISNPTTCLDSS